MKTTLTAQEMLELWRQGAGLEPMLSEASVERFDALEVNDLLRRAMRAWYADYLSTAPLDRVPVTDLTERLRLTRGPARDQWTVEWAGDVARVTRLTVAGRGEALIVDPDDPAVRKDQLLSRLANPFFRHGNRNCPIAFYRRGADTLILNSPGAKPPTISLLEGVAIPADDRYVVDERDLLHIPTLARQTLSL